MCGRIKIKGNVISVEEAVPVIRHGKEHITRWTGWAREDKLLDTWFGKVVTDAYIEAEEYDEKGTWFPIPEGEAIQVAIVKEDSKHHKKKDLLVITRDAKTPKEKAAHDRHPKFIPIRTGWGQVLAFTGHRPQHLFKTNPYDPRNLKKLTAFAKEIITSLQPDAVISGMALGWDTAIALAAIELRLPLIAAIPCKGQELKWASPVAINRYRWILNQATEIHILSNQYSSTCMQDRNVWMVEHADSLVALWNGQQGGTGNCVKYAKDKGKKVDNVYDQFQQYFV